ncbi:MAG: hypothetical protein FWF96_07345 [Kiritimatiellaeota bacterium]|nr:hypothetical protein [Kiritimatiellota bacterium]
MKKNCLFFTIFLFAHGSLGMDGIEWLKTSPWVDVVSVSSTNLLLQFKMNHLGVVQHDMYDKYLEDVKTNAWASPSRRSSEYIINNELCILTSDGQTLLTGGHAKIFFYSRCISKPAKRF